MTWNATERPRSGHTVANGTTSTVRVIALLFFFTYFIPETGYRYPGIVLSPPSGHTLISCMLGHNTLHSVPPLLAQQTRQEHNRYLSAFWGEKRQQWHQRSKILRQKHVPLLCGCFLAVARGFGLEWGVSLEVFIKHWKNRRRRSSVNVGGNTFLAENTRMKN